MKAGRMHYLLEELKVACDYFLKCHVADANGDRLEYYGYVGNGSADHGYCGPAETMTMARPSYKVTRCAPGSDLCGETAAPLAASSMVFRAWNPAYADILLPNARKLYQFTDSPQAMLITCSGPIRQTDPTSAVSAPPGPSSSPRRAWFVEQPDADSRGTPPRMRAFWSEPCAGEDAGANQGSSSIDDICLLTRSRLRAQALR